MISVHISLLVKMLIFNDIYRSGCIDEVLFHLRIQGLCRKIAWQYWHSDNQFYLIARKCAHLRKVIFAKIRVKDMITVIEGHE